MKSVALVIVLLFLFCYLHFCSTFWFLVVDWVKFCSIYFHKTHLAYCLSYFYAASLLQAMSRSTNISHQMEYLLATGNLVSRSGLGLMQVCCLPLVFPIYFTLLSFYSLFVFMSVKQPPTSASFPHFLFYGFLPSFLRTASLWEGVHQRALLYRADGVLLEHMAVFKTKIALFSFYPLSSGPPSLVPCALWTSWQIKVRSI